MAKWVGKLPLGIYRAFFRVFSGHGIGMIFPFRQINGFVVARLKKNFTVIDGHKMFLDKNDSLCLSTYGVYDELETGLIKKIVKKGGTAIDVGAHIGYYTLLLARQVGKKGNVFAFEPFSENFELLEKNVKANGYKNVTLEKKAVGEKKGKTRMYLNSQNRTLPSVFNLHKTKEFFEVEKVSLDCYLEKEEKIGFIKMDIEGAEYFALKGMEKTLKRNKNIKMIIEYGPEMIKKSGVEPEAFLKLLTKNGFALYEIDETKKKIVKTTEEKLLEKYSLERLRKLPEVAAKSTNLFCAKKNQIKGIRDEATE